MKTDAEPVLGQTLHEPHVRYAVFEWTVQRMVPHGKFKAVLKFLPAYLFEGISHRIRVDRRPGRKMMVQFPGRIEAQDQDVMITQVVRYPLVRILRGIRYSFYGFIKLAEMTEPVFVFFIISDPDDLIGFFDKTAVLKSPFVIIPICQPVSFFG